MNPIANALPREHHTMRKYKYLNNEDAPKRDVAYSAKGIATKYIFQRSSLDICYMVCDTVDEFFAYYSKKPPCSRMYFEVINDEFTAQKFKLDVDGRISMDEMEYMLKVVRRLLRKLTKCKPEMIVYDISTSHHIVITNLSFSATSCEMLANAVSIKVCKKYPTVASLIDTVVYKKLQMFRVEGSTKYAQRRWKYISGCKELSPLETFKRGIISYIDDCYHVEEERVVDVMLEIGAYHPVENKFAKKGSNGRIIPKEFVVRKTIDKLIILDRIAPSFCDICKRVHDKDGAYIVGQRLFCRRAQR
jgi:hypothetical protein